MKKKILAVLVLALMLFVSVATLTACNLGGGEEPHTHTYSSEWTYDETYHWHVATCEHAEEVSGKAEHNCVEQVIKPTCTEQGYTMHTCECGYSYKDNYVNEKGHAFSESWTYDDTHHWHGVTCEHTSEIKDKAEHDFINGVCECGYYTYESQGLEYSLNDDGNSYTVIGIGTCTDTELFIPKKYNNSPVTNIGHGAFVFCYSLQSVTIGNNVTTIGNSAFYYCSSLQSVTIGNSVTTIGIGAFEFCSSLTNVTIGNSVTIIDIFAFGDCLSLQDITIDEKNSNYKSIDGNLYSKDGKTLIQYAIGKQDTLFKIFNSVTTIGIGAFSGCSSLQSVEIPNSIITIGDGTFSNCSSLQSVEIPNSVITIGDGAFSGCPNLQYNEYDNGLYLGNSENKYIILVKAKDISITSCVINGNCKFIHRCSFEDHESLQSIEIPNSVTFIGGYAFEGCSSLQNVTIPDSVTTICDYAFYNCWSLKNVYYVGTIDDWVQIDFGYYGGNPLYNQAKLYVNNELVTNAIITKATIIKDCAFSSCSSIQSVKIGQSVTTIGYAAFGYCSSLQSLSVDEHNNNYKSLGDNLYSKDGKTLIQYAIGKQDKTFEIPNNVTTIGEDAFSGCSFLQSITIGNSVTVICNYAFFGSNSLQSVKMGNSVTTIGEYAFLGCSSLQSVTIGNNSVATIGIGAFEFCSSLTSIEIPDSVTTIGKYAFDGCYSLQSITFSDSSNWYITDSETNWQNKTGGTLTDLSNPTQNATYFKSKYYNYYWYKK